MTPTLNRPAMKVAWNSSAQQFYRELGKKKNGRAHRFYLGDAEDRAKANSLRLADMWRALADRWKRWRDAGIEESEFPQWDDTTLKIAQAIADGQWSVVVSVPEDIDSDGVAHWLADLRTTFPMMGAISIASPDAAEQVSNEMRRLAKSEEETEIKRHQETMLRLKGQYRGYGATIRTRITLHDALDSYVEHLHLKHRDIEGITTQTGLKQADRIKRIKRLSENRNLGDFNQPEIEEIINFWRLRPKSHQNKQYSATTCHHTITAFRAFIKWLHRKPDFPWRKPEDFEFERIKVVMSYEEKNARAFNKIFTRDQLAILWSHATHFQRKIMLLGLNCGFLRSEIGQLDWSHISGNRVRNLRPKTSVLGEYVLWDLTLKYLGPRKSSGLVVTTKNGNSVDHKTRGNNISAIVPNSWNKLISRVRKAHPDFERLPVKHLRKTGAQMIQDVSDGETASVFLQHGKPVPMDRELPSYTNPVFRKVFIALEKVWENLKDIFIDTEPAELPRKLTLQQITEIRRERRLGTKTKRLALIFGVSQDTIRRIALKNKK